MKIEIHLGARKTATTLLAIAAGLTLAHILAMFSWYYDWLPIDDPVYISFFDLDEEESLGTWFSSLILFGAGQLALLQAVIIQRQSHRAWHAWWVCLGFGFTVLSLDEVAGFHEFVNTVIEGTHWTTFGILIVALVGLAYLPFLRALPTRICWRLVLAGAIYVGGAIGVEWATLWYEENDQLDTLAYNLWNALEEFMEMAGVILFIFTLLDHISTDPNARDFNVGVSP